jgi:hypothetical protein
MTPLTIGWIAVYFAAATTGQQISRPPYFVYETQRACVEDTRQLRNTSKWLIACVRGTATGQIKPSLQERSPGH